MTLSDGYHDIPAGKIAVVVTHLEMLAKAVPRPAPQMPGAYSIEHVADPSVDWYRGLFRRVGGDWLWFSRLAMPDTALAAIIRDGNVEVYALSLEGRDVGLLELDFRVAGECELAFFGVAKELIGTGAARRLMNEGIERAWARPIGRFWVHTCTGDHPAAVAFYVRSGFRPFMRQIEIADDPRLSGGLPETAAPHVPMIRP